MIITSITEQKGNSKRCNIYIDYSYSFSADYEDIADLNIREDDELDETGLKKLIVKCQYKKALDKAYKMLSVRQRSEKEIRKKLEELDFDNSIIDEVLTRLKELKYLNDEEFARLWVEERRRLKPSGKRRLADELRNKGVDARIIEDTFNRCPWDDMGTAVDLAEKKLKLLNDTSDVRKNYQKIFRYLVYKGYDFETAHKAIEACTGKKEGLDD